MQASRSRNCYPPDVCASHMPLSTRTGLCLRFIRTIHPTSSAARIEKGVKIPVIMDYHPISTEITSLLRARGAWHETFEHEPVRTSEQAAQIRHGYTLHQGAKAILLRVKRNESEKFFAMLVFPGDMQFDKIRVKQFFHARDIRFATEQEVSALTGGILPGGVPPFGNLFNLRVIADPHLFENDKIIFNAGDRSFSVAMRADDYKQLVNPEIIEIVS